MLIRCNLLLVVEGGADGGAELGIFGDVETDFVEFLEHGVDVLALGQEGEVADEDTQTDCFLCCEDTIESLPFLSEVEVQNLHLKQQKSKVKDSHHKED